MTDSNSFTLREQPADTADSEDDLRPLRERIRDHPRPALVWLAGLAVLVLLEFGRFVAGVVQFGAGIVFVVEGIGALPGWIGSNVANAFSGLLGDGTLTEFIGATVSDVLTLLLLFGVAVIIHSYLPWRSENLFDTDLSPRTLRFAERAVIALLLTVVAVLLAFTPIGAFAKSELSFWVSQLNTLSSIPTLTSPETIPNLGYRTPSGGWEGTFLGLSPKWAWAIRFTLVWVYAFAFLAWFWKGYNIYRDHYRVADWTPRDDTVRRFRNHYWGLFGLFVVVGFVVLGAFAPAISPVPIEENVYEPYNNEFTYLNDDGELEETLHGTANIQTRSNNRQKVGLWSYDQYDRFAPLGTTPNGQDMLTHVAYGARTSLIIALSAVSLGLIIAVTLSLMTAYYKGLLDILVILASDTIISIPVLLLAMMIVVVFGEGNHPIAQPLDGGLLLSIILGFAYWPGMWRAIRGPSLQVAEEEWVDAAKCYGQTPTKIMRKHMAPYIISYIIIYASLLIGGVIIVVSALSFLGLGINPPTPEWGRLINSGQPFVGSQSWHVATVPGLLIAMVVLAFNALGDALRDALDPEADIEDAGAGGGG